MFIFFKETGAEPYLAQIMAKFETIFGGSCVEVTYRQVKTQYAIVLELNTEVRVGIHELFSAIMQVKDQVGYHHPTDGCAAQLIELHESGFDIPDALPRAHAWS